MEYFSGISSMLASSVCSWGRRVFITSVSFRLVRRGARVKLITMGLSRSSSLRIGGDSSAVTVLDELEAPLTVQPRLKSETLLGRFLFPWKRVRGD